VKLHIMQFSASCSHLGPNMFLSTVFANTLCLRSARLIRDHVSYRYTYTQTYTQIYEGLNAFEFNLY